MTLEAPFTISGIVDEVQDVLSSYTRNQGQSTSLAAAMSDTDLTFTVTADQLLSRGLVEIGDELIYVGAVDPDTGVASVEPWGRGQSGTTPQSHSQDSRVTVAPLYPRRRVGNIVASVLREVFPHLFAVDQTLISVNPSRTNYVLPDDAYHVLSVEWNWPGPSQMWAPVDRWRQNKPTTGVELELISGTWPGQDRVRVKYAKNPKSTWAMTDDLGDYGYDTEIRDVVVLGTTARALAYTEPSRIQVQSLEAHGRSEAVPPGAISDASRYLMVLFRQRLEEERQQILLRHPIQPHRTR